MYEFRHFLHVDPGAIRGLYERLEREGLYESFFYARQQTSADGFLAYSIKEAWSFTIERDGVVIGFAMLSDFDGESARIHVCFFREGWADTLRAARAGFKWLLTACPSVTVLHGVTPASNTLMVRFLKKAGFTVVGRVPRALSTACCGTVDAVISYYDLKEAGA